MSKSSKSPAAKPVKSAFAQLIAKQIADSNHAIINAVLRKAQKPLSMKEIKERSGLPNTYYVYCNRLVSLGIATKDSEGRYALVPLSPLAKALEAKGN